MTHCRCLRKFILEVNADVFVSNTRFRHSLADSVQEAQEWHGERPARAATELASLVGDLERQTQEPEHGSG